MRKLYKILFLIVFIHSGAILNAKGNSSVNNLVLPAAAISGTTTVCQNAAQPQITFTGSGGTAPYTFTYTVTGVAGNQTIATTSGNSVTVPAPTTNTGSFVYTLVSVSDSSGTQAQSGNATVTVNASPDAAMGGTGSGSNFNGVPVFRICSNTVTAFTFTNTSITPSLNSNYTINWGDGSTDFNSASWSTTTHTYAVGIWNLIYTIQGNNGCNTTKNYLVFVGSNPAVSLGNPGNTDICNSSSLTFPITGTTNNPPGTTYTVTFNDGSTPQIYNHPPPSSVTHTFLKSSCGVTSSDGTNSYPNSFSAIIVASNPCNISSVGVVPIYVSTPPIANFTLPTKGCVNTSICMTNSSTGAYENNGSNSSCNTSPKIIWSISPSTGFSISSGSLGNDFGSSDPNLWQTGSNTLCLNFSQAGTYTITMKTGNRCGSDTKIQTICIEPLLTPQFTLNNTSGCTPLAITATNTTVTTNSCTPPTYVWNVTHTPAYCGASIAAIPNQTTPNATYNFTEPGTYSITLTATNSCGSFPISQTVTVKKPPTVSINPIANVCQTANSTSINPTAIVPACANATYAWSFPGGTPATSTLAVPGAISYTTAGNHTISLSVTNECGTTIATDRIFTINPSPTIIGDLFSCVGFTSQLTGSATAATTSPWTSSNTTIATVNSTGLVTAVSGGTTTITYTNANNCKTTEVFTVNPAPTITPLVSSTVCIGGTLNVLSFTISGATGTPTYQWYSNTTNSNTGGSIIPSETNSTYTPPSTTAGIVYYYCIITLPSGGCSNIKTNTATVTIMPNPTIATQPTPTQNLCVGVTVSTPLSITYSGGTGTASYQWYSNSVNSNIGGTLIAGATSSTYTPPVFTITGNYYYYATVSLSGNGCLPATSNVAEVIVFADPTISSQPTASQTLCQSATPLNLDVTTTGGNGTFSYQWYSNSTNTNTGGTLIAGATSNSYTPPTNTVGTKYYYSVVSQNGTSGCSVTSSTAAIVVISAPTISQPVSSTVCQGGSPTVLSITVSGATGTPTYQWYSNLSNNTTTGTAISGETNSTYTPSASTVGTTYYYCIITLPSGGCSSITSNTATVTINAGATITTQPTATQSLCVGATIATPLTVSYSGGSGGVSYQWYSNTTNLNTGGTLIPGATNANYTPAVFNTSGNYYYYVILSFSGNGCGPITSNLAEILVVSDPTVSSQPLVSQTLCQGAPPTNLTVTATGGIGTYSYQWFSSVSNSNSGGILIAGETNSSYTPSTTSVGTIYYYCVISQTGIGCNATSATVEVIVNLAPTITTQPQSSTVCLGITPTLLKVTYSNGVGTPTYQWYSNTVNSILGSTPISGATNATYTPQNTVVGTTYYYCIITLPTGGCSSLTSNIATVTINQNPVISNKTAIICSGNSFSITPDNLSGDTVPAGATYIWSNPTISPTGSITGASAQNVQQTSISQSLINTTTSPATVSYTVTPLSGICVGATFTSVVTVNPAISPNVTSNNSSCFGANNGAIQTNITGGIPFSSGAPYLISWTGPNGFTSSASNISNLAPGNYNLSIADAGGCPTAKTYPITEPAEIIITTDLEKDITCFNSADGAIKITLTGGTLNYKIAWTKNGIPFAMTEDLSNLSPGTYVVSVSDANNCVPKTATFTITEPPILAINLVNKTNILCFGDSTGSITVNVVGGTGPYTFAWSGPNGFSSPNQNLTALFAGTYTLIVTDNSGCAKNLSVPITQTPEIKITANTTPIVCYGDNNASINLVVSGGVAPYSIAWSNLGTGTSQNNLSAGDYTITVTDALNCTKTLTVNIPEAPIFTVNPVVKNISCFGTNNGSITLNFVGGIAPVKLTWSDGSTAGTTRNNLGPGSYTVTIVDGKPCTITRTFIILEPQLLVLSANITHALDCNNANTGAINLLVSGGSAPFTYTWSNGATTEDLSNIPAGNYLVTVTDANGCTKQAQYSINRPPPIVTGVVTKTDFDCETKYVKQTFVADVSGGVPPYQLVWSSGTVSGANNEFMNTTQNGTVILTATDAIGCKSNYTFTVAIPTLGSPSFNVGSYAYSTYGAYSINDPIQFTNTATGDYISVAWDFGDGTFSTELNPVHSFINPKDYVVTQTVTYPFGCVYVQKITLVVGKGYVLVVPNAFTPNNDTLNDTFRPVTKALKNVHLDVYDTWGSLIYSETGDVLRGWDGKIKGINAENGNYFCKVSGETFYGTIVNDNHPFVLIK
ncbi:MAG: gliding motility-associated C-terminal domain-containing protein [Flavobacterium sp.]|nr:gliding motility-associated C-terminal domain-containing protein [Flavobacterium sp.]